MARNVVCYMALVLAVAGCINVQETKRVYDDKAALTYAPARRPSQVLRHVVLLKFNEGTSAADIRTAQTAFRALPSKIDAIYDFEWGTDVSVENLQKGFTHCCIVTFLDEADRDAYLPHPAHEALGETIRPFLDEVMVIDYWAK
ncbi:MAG: Dabb family protein [Sedimentisphaerales bacterium]|nr:Dabb family protein [Sedimentisphaerales bacterium]